MASGRNLIIAQICLVNTPQARDPLLSGFSKLEPPAFSCMLSLSTYLCRAAIWMLNFYKTGISPLMPSSCRFLPTCSSYSMDSYRKYGELCVSLQPVARHVRPWVVLYREPQDLPSKVLFFRFSTIVFVSQIHNYGKDRRAGFRVTTAGEP